MEPKTRLWSLIYGHIVTVSNCEFSYYRSDSYVLLNFAGVQVAEKLSIITNITVLLL